MEEQTTEPKQPSETVKNQEPHHVSRPCFFQRQGMRPCLYLVVCLIVALVVFLPIAFTQDLFDGLRGSGESQKSSSPPVAEKVECVLFVVDGIPEPGSNLNETDSDECWTCVDPVNRTVYSVEGLPDDFFEVNRVISGVTTLTVTSTEEGSIVRQGSAGGGTQAPDSNANYTIDVGNGNTNGGSTAELTLYASGESISTSVETMEIGSEDWTSKTHGRASVLVVRAIDGQGVEPDHSAAEISDFVFGTNGDLVNLRSQYLACSGGKLEFVPAQGENIVGGVLEVFLDDAVEGVDRTLAASWVTDAIPKFLKGQVEIDFDYSLYVIPPGSDFGGAAAYASVGGRNSVYNNHNIATVLVQMHEVGHNLGMRHSGYEGSTYGDHTCFEGAHLYSNEAPVMCFNAAKSWFLGWYNDDQKQGHQLIQPLQGSWAGRLVGIDEYIHNENYSDEEYKVVLKVETNHEDINQFPDLYIMFNRKQGVNKSVQGFGDKVNVVSQTTEWGEQSWLVGMLDDGDGTDTFVQSNFDGSGRDLVIKVCEMVYEHPMPDYVSVLVYLDEQTSRLDCETSFTTSPVVQWD